jgi:hypothetical protein
MESEVTSYEISEGELRIWLDDAVCLKAITPKHQDPVELTDDLAIELAERLLTLVRIRNGPLPSVTEIGEVDLWYDGCVCIKTQSPKDGHAVLSDERAVILAERLLMLVRTQERAT